MAIDLAFLENAGSVLHAHDFRRILRGEYLGEGVVTGTDLDVTQRGAGANMSVDVAAGQCLIWEDGSQLGLYPLISTAVVNVPIAASGAQPRIDIIVARVRDTELGDGSDSKTIEVVAGTPSGSPVVPATPTRAFKLAEVAVAAGAVSITNANITERRVWAPGAAVARGSLSRLAHSGGVTTSTTPVPIPGSDRTATIAAARTVRYITFGRVHSTVANDIITIQIYKDSSGTGVQADIPCGVANTAYPFCIFTTDAPSAGSHTYEIKIARGSGSGTITIDSGGPTLLEDIGAAPIT